MGNDGVTTDEHGHVQYLLDSSTWVEELPDLEGRCVAARRYRSYCKGITDFLSEYQNDGCTI
ncbi:CO4 protein, partial [Amia calva]|nr:CO4 protein [Amia calva]